MGLLQVGLNDANGEYIEDVEAMKAALIGSPYTLDEEQTRLNDGIAMIVTPSESEAMRLMELGYLELPSGCSMEIPTA